AIDLSGGDEQSVIAFGWHGGDNQKWKFEDSGNGLYHIQNVKYGKYLTFPDEPNDGKQVIATDGPREWEVPRIYSVSTTFLSIMTHDSQQGSIFVPGTNQNLDLTNHGDITPGNPVQLWARTPGKGQAWYAIPG
ncbi:ricin B lectin domain-containing protein, partial [Rhizoctonia solani]